MYFFITNYINVIVRLQKDAEVVSLCNAVEPENFLLTCPCFAMCSEMEWKPATQVIRLQS